MLTQLMPLDRGKTASERLVQLLYGVNNRILPATKVKLKAMKSQIKRIVIKYDRIKQLYYKKHLRFFDERGITNDLIAVITEDCELETNDKIILAIELPTIKTFDEELILGDDIESSNVIEAARIGAQRIRSALSYLVLRHTLIHEAGHAVAAFLLKREIKHVEIRGLDRGGEVKYKQEIFKDRANRNEIDREVLLHHAGFVAERIFFGVTGAGTSGEDSVEAWDWACQIDNRGENADYYSERKKQEIEERLKLPDAKAAIIALARVLWNRHPKDETTLHIEGAEAEEIISEAMEAAR